MTAIIAVRYDKGVIIGSDLLKSSPMLPKPFFDRKLWPLNDCVFGIAGQLPPNFQITFFDNFPSTETHLRSGMVKFGSKFSNYRIHAMTVSRGPQRKIHIWADGSLYTDWWGTIGERLAIAPPTKDGTATEQIQFVQEYLLKAKTTFPDRVGWMGNPQVLNCPDNGGLIELNPTTVQLPLPK